MERSGVSPFAADAPPAVEPADPIRPLISEIRREFNRIGPSRSIAWAEVAIVQDRAGYRNLGRKSGTLPFR